MRLVDPDIIDSIASCVDSVEGPFRETTRNGKHTLRSVFLTLTPSLMCIAERSTNSKEYLRKIPSVHLSDSLEVVIFKKSKRQTLKICFTDESKRYFELEEIDSGKIVWTTWCQQVANLHHTNKNIRLLQTVPNQTTGLDWNIINQKWEPKHFVWNDKYLYLGSKREDEDQSRPSPLPGLGCSEDIKLLYLKPQYFGCWDQSEHWVQCESSKHLKCDDDAQ